MVHKRRTRRLRPLPKKPRFPPDVTNAMWDFIVLNRYKWHQTGGGSDGGSGGVIYVDGVRYRYWNDPKGTVLGGGTRQKPCFVLLYQIGDEAILQSVREGSDCSLDDNATSRHMLRAAVALAIHRGATVFKLTDNSTKYLEDGRSFRLSDMYFLSMGVSWYESAIPNLRPEAKYVSGVERRRHRVKTNTWDSVYACLKKHVDIEEFEAGSAPGSAMQVFRMLKDARTDFFAEYEEYVRQCSGIETLNGIPWTLDLVKHAVDYADVRVVEGV